jgi:hypothetical protein
MGGMIINALKPAILEFLDKILKGSPATVKTLLAQVITWLGGSTDTATGVFRKNWADLTTKLVVWLPTTEGKIVGLITRGSEFVKQKIKAL